MHEETFFEKLKSWKRWAAFFAAAFPILMEAITGAQGWGQVVPEVVAALLFAMGVLAADDHSKRKAALAAAAINQSKPNP